MFWIHDLSLPDPYHVMSLTMAGSMILQQKITPQSLDQRKVRIMWIMPLMLTYQLLSSQSGLMLYWITSNVVGIGQQYLENKYCGPGSEPAPKKRAGKKEQIAE